MHFIKIYKYFIFKYKIRYLNIISIICIPTMYACVILNFLFIFLLS